MSDTGNKNSLVAVILSVSPMAIRETPRVWALQVKG
jgi:hypothetical protein